MQIYVKMDKVKITLEVWAKLNQVSPVKIGAANLLHNTTVWEITTTAGIQMANLVCGASQQIQTKHGSFVMFQFVVSVSKSCKVLVCMVWGGMVSVNQKVILVGQYLVNVCLLLLFKFWILQQNYYNIFIKGCGTSNNDKPLMQ